MTDQEKIGRLALALGICYGTLRKHRDQLPAEDLEMAREAMKEAWPALYGPRQENDQDG